MSNIKDSDGRLIYGEFHGAGELINSGVTSEDGPYVAKLKRDAYVKRQQEHNNRFKTAPLGHVEDMRSQYQKALSKAKIQNAMRLVLILMASAVLFFALNTIIGGNIRDNSLYGSRTSTASLPWRWVCMGQAYPSPLP